MNEFEAAMGLCVLDEIEVISQQRKKKWDIYKKELRNLVSFQEWSLNSENNCAYAPILLKSEDQLLKVESNLKAHDIIARRYFYPSLDSLEYLKSEQICAVSRSVASRILCLPIYPDLAKEEQMKVIQAIKDVV